MKNIIVSEAAQVVANILAYQREIERSADLADRIRQHVAWYAIRAPDGRWMFGPSKFIGYLQMNSDKYLAISGHGGEANGRETERKLEEWFVQEPENTARFRELKTVFEEFANRFGKTANRRWRISLLPEAQNQASKDQTKLLRRILTDPEICGGRPCVRGTRVRVADVLSMMSGGISRETILADYPYLSPEDIDACLAWAAMAVDHRIVRAA